MNGRAGQPAIDKIFAVFYERVPADPVLAPVFAGMPAAHSASMAVFVADWMTLLLECGDEIGVPDDPEFRSALVAYLEWGSRLAVVNSQPGVPAPEDSPMPAWDWGVPKGPYRP